MNRAQNHTAVYPHEMRPTQYDGAHFLVYLNGIEADYKPDDDSESIPGISYSGNMEDGGTLIECDEWNRDKLINGIIRSRYLQTEEDAIKTHRLQVLSSKIGIGELSEIKSEEYAAEWEAFESFRKEAIELVNSWDTWE